MFECKNVLLSSPGEKKTFLSQLPFTLVSFFNTAFCEDYFWLTFFCETLNQGQTTLFRIKKHFKFSEFRD